MGPASHRPHCSSPKFPAAIAVGVPPQGGVPQGGAMRFRGEEPETRFRIAPAGPKAVAEAYQTYTRVAAEFEAAKSKLAALPDEARAAVNAAHEAQAAARVAGSAPP